MNDRKIVMPSRFEEAKMLINNKLSIQDFLAEHGIHVESNKQICCPLHDDSTPSFSVNLNTNEWKCFGCPDGGHYADLWMKYLNKNEDKHYTIYTAVEAILHTNENLCKELGFNTIYQVSEDEFDTFSRDKQRSFIFNKLEQELPPLSVVKTDSMHQVMKKLHTSPNVEQIIDFVTDCELGASEQELISKYLYDNTDVTDYLKQYYANDAETIDRFLEALKD